MTEKEKSLFLAPLHYGHPAPEAL